ncbi:MAG: FKBP-type peptidyl-prolyl cis-trans isomerase (trigger factor) [Candidatus Omnitrophota bacterium]|jgi:FKBP-type peptidyl-prolyl cis-trans isomerase (trigger factor)
MKVEVKKVNEVKRELKFEVPQERVIKTFDEVYKDLAKVAKIKGFRKGKVPRQILEQRHGNEAKDEMLKKVIQDVYQEGVVQEKLAPLDYPNIEDVNYKDGVVTFTAKLDVKPEIKVKDYKGVKVKRKSSKVTDDDINKTLEYFKQGQGDDKEVKIDDEFAKGLGYPTLEEFKSSLSRQIELDKDRQNKADVENQVVDHILKKTKVTIPESLVKKQLEYRIHEQKQRLQQQGIPQEEIDKKEEEMRKELKDPVEKDVKVYLIFDKIAQEEKIEVKENENLPAKVMEFLLKEAVWENEK